jgi:WD40 repeat protein/tRNA A-37 threonylcarbamoyl transferase component Bud32
MPRPFDSQESAALCDFLDLWLEDRSNGRLRPLAEYLRRFPGHEEEVAREFIALDREKEGAAPEEPPTGTDRLGRYRLIDELGRGGQGTVFLAEDVRLRRQVAVKFLEAGLGGVPSTRLARLKREAEALSRLDHPRLCAVYDADLESNRPYFAMRYVPGETLAQRIERARSEGRDGGAILLGHLPATRREIDAVVLFIEQAARAIHVAHEAGIIHRDLKPGNLMIDAQSEPVVLDFGLARDLGDEGVAITLTGDAFGTLSYMAPEQLSGEGEPDRRADVYSLAVTLYECLTFRRPVEAATREALLRGILTGVREDPTRINKALPRDLATVLACALDVDRGRRYGTALAFAEDLRRVREKEPILAKRAGWWILTRRWAQRHPAAFAGGLAAFTLLVAGLAVTVGLLARVTREQAQTRREQSRLMALRQAYQAQILGNEKPALALRLGIEAARREHHPEIDNILYDLLDRCREKRTFTIGGPPDWVTLGFEPLIDSRGRLVVAYGGGLAEFDLATGVRTDLLTGQVQERGEGLAGPPRVAMNAARDLLVSAHSDGALRFFELGATPRLRELRATDQKGHTWVELSADDRRVATGCQDGAVTLHEVAPGGDRVAFRLPERSIQGARWNPSGALVAAWGLVRPARPDSKPSAAVFDSKTGSRLAELGPTGVSATFGAWSRAGDRLAIAFEGVVRVFRASDWSEELSLVHGDRVYWVAFHPDDRQLVTGSTDGVSVWDLATGRRTARAGDFRERSVVRGAFSPDGSKLAVVSWDHTGSIFDCATWREETKLRGMGRPRGICWSADGESVVTTDEATAARVWYAGARRHLPVLEGHGDRVIGAAFLEDGEKVLTTSVDGKARIFDAATGALLRALDHGKPLVAARLGTMGTVLTVGGGRIGVWDGASGARLRELVQPGASAVDAWPRTGGRVFAIYDDGAPRLWNAEAGTVLQAFEAHGGPVQCAAFLDGSELVATGGADRTVKVHDLARKTTIRSFSYAARTESPAGTSLARVFALAFTKGGDRLVAGCEDVSFRIWDLKSGNLLREQGFPTPGMLELAPSGRWMMMGAKWLGRVCFLDLAETSAPIYVAPFQESHMNAAVHYSPGGELALVASRDGMVRLWSMDLMRPHSLFEARCGVLLDAAFSPDGKRIVVAGSSGSARIWPVDPLAVAERVCPVTDEVWETMQPTVDQAVFAR